MTLRNWSLGLVALMLVAPMSASALGISVANVSSSGASTSLLADGDILTVDLVLENATNEDVFGLGVGINGYDVNSDGTAINNHLVFLGGQVADSAFDIVGGNIAGAGLDNIRSAAVEQGQGPPFLDPLRVSLFDGASLSARNGDGTLEDGVDGNTIASGDVHFRVQFVAQAGLTGITGNAVTLDFGTGFFGNAAIGAGGAHLDFDNDTLTVTVVPEPGTALLMGLGLVGLAARRR